MILVVRPNEGVGDIDFGMSQSAVRDLLGSEVLRKETDTPVAADYYPARSLIVHYAADSTVEAIELGAKANAILMNRTLIGEPFDEIAIWMREIDPRIHVDSDGLTSFRFGIGLYAPHALKTPHDPIMGLIAFRPGYYG